MNRIFPDKVIILHFIYKASKKGAEAPNLITIGYKNHYLFITYIVTSKPNLISVAAGLVHIVFLLKIYTHDVYN
jgi:hypothetical protein